jgi:hypothetical protein
MNNSGKTLTIFLFVIAVLLISLTAIAVFFFLKEVDLRKSAEFNLDQMRIIESKLQTELQETKKQLFLLEEKNKEAEDKVESLMGEVDLEQGLAEELKKENKQLQETVEKETKSKEDLQAQLEKNLSESEQKLSSLQEKLDTALAEKQKIETTHQDLLTKYQQLQQQLGISEPLSENISTSATPAPAPTQEVSLDKIVVNPPGESRGQVISVDTETEFVIVSLGERDGVRKNAILSIYRADKYLGDVKVTRVLPEMSAADFVPPLTSQAIQKDDRVVLKQ